MPPTTPMTSPTAGLSLPTTRLHLHMKNPRYKEKTSLFLLVIFHQHCVGLHEHNMTNQHHCYENIPINKSWSTFQATSAVMPLASQTIPKIGKHRDSSCLVVSAQLDCGNQRGCHWKLLWLNSHTQSCRHAEGLAQSHCHGTFEVISSGAIKACYSPTLQVCWAPPHGLRMENESLWADNRPFVSLCTWLRLECGLDTVTFSPC